MVVFTLQQSKMVKHLTPYIYMFCFCSVYLFLGASLVAQRVKCLLAVRETWARSLGQEGPLEKEMAAQSNVLAWRTPGQRSLGAAVHGVAEPDVTGRLHFLFLFLTAVFVMSHDLFSQIKKQSSSFLF